MFSLAFAHSISMGIALFVSAAAAETWIPLSDQGNLLRGQGHCRQAVPVLSRARAAAINELGPHHQSVAVAGGNLAAAYLCLGEMSRAERHFREALAILEDNAADPTMPGILNNLGLLLMRLTRNKEAEEVLHQALARSEGLLGPDHPHTAAATTSLGVLQLRSGEYEQARDLFRRSLAVWEVTRGADHVDTAAALNNLGVAYLYLGEYERGKEFTARALDLRRRLLPPGHPDIAESLYNHAVSLKKLNQSQAASAAFREAASIRQTYAHENLLGITVDLRVLERK